MNNEKKNTILKILLILSLICLLLFVIFVIHNKKKYNYEENNTVDEYDNINKFDTSNSESMFNIDEVQRNVSFNDTLVIKIKITMDNKTDVDADMKLYKFETTDSSKNVIGTCYNKAFNVVNTDDMFPEISLANSKTEGYLYCDSILPGAAYLKVSYILDGYIDDDGKLAVNTKDFYLELK